MDAAGTIRPLLLAGGMSSRMGSPKHLLVRPDGEVAYRHAMRLLRAALPQVEEMCVSVRDEEQVGQFGEADERVVRFLFDMDTDIGPAAGLLAAYAYDPDACWLVVACDYPIVDEEALQQLLKAYEAPVTCFVNGDGYAEPLLAVWSPVALRALAENLRIGASVGPSRIVRAINGKLIEPERKEWLVGANTRDEWEKVVRILQKRRDRKRDSDGLSGT